MREQDFIRLYEADWQALQQFLSQTAAQRDIQDTAAFPARYRRLCEQLALAQAQGFSSALITRLNRLAGNGHALLYQKPHSFAESAAEFILQDFPRAVRAQWRWLLLSALLFIVPLIIGIAVAILYPEWADKHMGHLARMYEPTLHERLGRSRLGGTDVYMWGYYIFHNTGISLQIIAGGALAGMLSLYSVVFNGVYLGMASGYMLNRGWLWQTFLPFVIAHSAFELTALVMAGAIAFALSFALFFPGRIRRRDCVGQCLQRQYPLLVGVIAFDFIAAALEAFWSARLLPVSVKYSVGILLWAGVTGYFLLVGRDAKTDN